MSEIEIDACLSVAHRLADAARPLALQYFRAATLTIEDKSSAGQTYDPVTMADRAIEAEMRRILADLRPDDGILGEEFDPLPSRSGITWVLDPIDGTRAFMSGLPTWGVLIAVNDGTRPVIGIMDQPFTGERFTGTAATATLTHAGATRSLHSRDTATLDEAVLCCTDPSMFQTDAERASFAAISAQARLTRFGTDCYAYAMLAAGQVDLVVESSLKPYDIQAMMPIVTGAGGIVTDWRGGDPQPGGQALAAASKPLHEAALRVLSGA